MPHPSNPSASGNQAPASPRPLTRRLRGTVVLLSLLGTLGLIGFASLRPSWAVYGPAGVSQVRLLHPILYDLLPSFLLAGFFLPVAAASLLLAHRRFRLGVALMLAAVVFGCLALVSGFDGLWYPWQWCDRFTAPDGKAWGLIEAKDSLALGRVQSSGPFYVTLDVLGVVITDPQVERYVKMIRPSAGNHEDEGQFYATANGQLAALKANRCYLVYDISKGQFLSEENVEALSPYLLLNAQSPLYVPDEADILQAIGGADPRGLPTAAALKQALGHPNPAVQQSAARILKALPSLPTP